MRLTLLPLILRLGERRDVIFVPRPTDAASLAFLLLGVAAFAAAVLSALLTERDEREGAVALMVLCGSARKSLPIALSIEREGTVALKGFVGAPL